MFCVESAAAFAEHRHGLRAEECASHGSPKRAPTPVVGWGGPPRDFLDRFREPFARIRL